MIVFWQTIAYDEWDGGGLLLNESPHPYAQGYKLAAPEDRYSRWYGDLTAEQICDVVKQELLDLTYNRAGNYFEFEDWTY